MPVCKHCGSRIEKFHKDRCPICGEKLPLEDVGSDTVDITTSFAKGNFEFEDIKLKKKATFAILGCACGFTGAHYFYLGHKKTGFIWLLFNIVFISILFAILFFGVKINPYIAFLIPLAASYLFNIVFSILVYFNSPSLRDGDGNLIR